MNDKIRIINKKEVKSLFKNNWYYNFNDIMNYFDINDYKVSGNMLILNTYMPYNIYLKKICINYIRYYFFDNENLIKLIILINNDKTSIYKKYIYKLIIERTSEIINPELAIDRVKTIYYKKGIEVKYFIQKNEYLKNEYLINNKILSNNELFKEDINIIILD